MFCAQVYVLFVREVEKRHVVYCVDCARRTAPTPQSASYTYYATPTRAYARVPNNPAAA